MLTFPTNTVNFIGRFFFLALTFYLCYLFLNLGLKDPSNGHVIFKISIINFEFKVVYIFYFLIAAVLFLALTIIVSLLSFNKVLVDTYSGTITFIAFFYEITIQTSDIDEYFDTIHRNAAANQWNGVLLKLKDNTTIQVAGQNIKSLSDLKNYLDDNKIICVGLRKMKFPFN